MEEFDFNEIIDVRKVAACTTCATFIYKLPCNLDKDIETYLYPLGKLAYPLDKVQIIKIDNDIISLSNARIGANSFRVKFKNEVVKYKELFDIQIASFVSTKQNIVISI